MDGTWTFRKGEQQLVIERREEGRDRLLLTIASDEHSRSIPFEDIRSLTVFHKDTEEFLVRTGWTLSHFSPERRTGRDRRLFPRPDCDRRRWWTDGTADLSPARRTIKS